MAAFLLMIMRSAFLYGLTSSLLFAGGAVSFAESMDEAVRKAIANHPAVERAAISADVAKQDMVEQRSEFFPKISTTLTGGRLYGDNATSRGLSVTRGAGYSWLWEGNAALNQMLYDWNQTSDRVNAADAERMAALYSYDDAKDAIALQTVQSYIALDKAQTLYNEAQDYLNAMRDYRNRINKLVDGGGADEAEGSRARDLVLAAENMIAGLKGQLSAAEASYKEVVGELPQTALTKPDLPFLLDHEQDLDALIRRIQDHHPQVKAALEQVESQEYTISADEKEVLPQLGSELSYNKKDQDDIIGGESIDARAVVRMTWNLDTGGAQFARARKAKLQKDQTLTQIEELRRTLERSLRISMAGLEMAVEQRDIQKKRYDELVTTLDTYKKQFEAAQKRLLEVATTESQVFAAKNEYLSSEYAVLEAAYAFLASQGALTEAMDILAAMDNQKRAEMPQDSQAMQTAEFKPYADEDGTVQEEQVAMSDVARERKPAVSQERSSPVGMQPVMDDEPMLETASYPQAEPAQPISNVQMSPVVEEIAEETVMKDRLLIEELDQATPAQIENAVNETQDIGYEPVSEVDMAQDPTPAATETLSPASSSSTQAATEPSIDFVPFSTLTE